MGHHCLFITKKIHNLARPDLFHQVPAIETARKGTVARDFTALFLSSKVSILGPDSYPKFFSNMVSNSQSYSNLKFDSPLHYAAGSQKKVVSWKSFNT
jgi:hypothetical protein